MRTKGFEFLTTGWNLPGIRVANESEYILSDNSLLSKFISGVSHGCDGSMGFFTQPPLMISWLSEIPPYPILGIFHSQIFGWNFLSDSGGDIALTGLGGGGGR